MSENISKMEGGQWGTPAFGRRAAWLMIVLMALDHANYMVALRHSSGEYWGGYFLYDDPLAFINRFVTHLCAPGFFFLMGAGMLLFAESRREKGWSRWQILRHFWIRGAVLIGCSSSSSTASGKRHRFHFRRSTSVSSWRWAER